MDKFLIRLPTNSAPGAVGSCKKRKREPAPVSHSEQMFLDIGQKVFGKNSACSRCGMVYVSGQPDDEARHAAFCKKANASIKIIKRTKCRTVAEGGDYDIVEYIGPREKDDTLRRILETVCSVLGTPLEMAPPNSKIFLCVVDADVVGFLNVEAISFNKCVPLSKDDDMSLLSVGIKSGGSSNEAGGLVMGVRQIWVQDEHRRQGVSGRLMDSARREFIRGGVKKSAIAFSQPTAAGRQFAFSYIKKDSILAYS